MELLLTYTHCPVCDSSEIANKFSAIDYTVSSENFEIWECQDCTACFTQNVPRETEIGRYYKSEDYVSHSNTQKGIINRLYHFIRNYTLDQKFRRVKRVSKLSRGENS